MTRSSPPKEDLTRPEDSPIAWFGEMLLALDRRDIDLAAEAKRQLARLGWSVQYRQPRQAPHTPRHEADGRGVAHDEKDPSGRGRHEAHRRLQANPRARPQGRVETNPAARWRRAGPSPALGLARERRGDRHPAPDARTPVVRRTLPQADQARRPTPLLAPRRCHRVGGRGWLMTISPMPDKPSRRRRTRAEMDGIREAMIRLTRENQPLTVRQLFYLLVTAKVIDKTEAEYKQTAIRLALDLRRAGVIPWEWVVDRTRWFFKPKTYDSLLDALEATAQVYRRSLWTDADARVQVWCESLSVAGIIDDETARWDVPLYPGKGYSSHDFLRSAARDIADGGVDTVVYLLGDYDPSGRDIIRFVCKTLREYADEVDPSVHIDFQTVAVTEQQIVEWSLPGHPAKRTDSRHRRYGIDHAVELEAIPPERLRGIVRDCIIRHIDSDAYRRLMEVEAAERETLLAIAEGGGRP